MARERGQLGLGRPGLEVRLDDRRDADAEQLAEVKEEQREGRPPEPLRPGAVAGAERVEQRLLEVVLRDEREPELPGERAGDRRLARTRRSRDDDEERLAQGASRRRT
jgi:hypothetical protein